MKKCNSCDLYFPETELNIGETGCECIKCSEPWAEHKNAFPGIVKPPAWLDLLDKATFRHTRTEIYLPMPGKPESSYLEAVVFEDKAHYFHIEGRSTKFKCIEDAIKEVIELADIMRLKLLNEAFEKEFGGSNGRKS